MRRGIPRLAALLGAVALVLTAVPAAALSPFGSPVEIYEPDCRAFGFDADGVMGSDGILRGFTSAAGDNCAQYPVIRYFEQDGSSVTNVSTPYRGRVIAATADTTGQYLVYTNRSGLHLAKRSGGSFTSGRRLSKAQTIQGDIIANGGDWWAVWTEASGKGALRLTHARTMGTDVLYQRLSLSGPGVNVVDWFPSLALRSGNRAVMVWSRYTPNRWSIWVATTEADGNWRARPFGPATMSRTGFPLFPSVAVSGPATYVAWQDDETIMVSDNASRSWKSRSFVTPGVLPKVATSAGKVFVGWTTTRTSAPRAFITQRVGSTWSGNFVSPPTPHAQVTMGVYADDGDATSLIRSPVRLYSRSQ
jgi:hypothetical protein